MAQRAENCCTAGASSATVYASGWPKWKSRLDARILDLSAQEFGLLALFVGLLFTRVPAFRNLVQEAFEHPMRWMAKAGSHSLEAVEEWLLDFELETGRGSDSEMAKGVYEMIRDDNYEIEISTEFKIKMMLDMAHDVTLELTKMNWEFVSPPKRFSFITGDNPFTTLPMPGATPRPEAFGFRTPGIITYIPLSKKTGITFRGLGGSVKGYLTRRQFVRDMNMHVATNSGRFVLSGHRALLESLVRRGRLDRWEPEPVFEFSSSDPYLLRKEPGWTLLKKIPRGPIE